MSTSDRYAHFAATFLPMLVAHALVPPLASAYGAESNAWWSLPLKPAVLEKHFVYSKEAVRRGRWWTVVSYMFLHADYAHLFSNLQGLMLSGPGALEVFGPLGAMVVYLLGGAAAALDLPRLYDLQLERGMSSVWHDARAYVERTTAQLGVNAKNLWSEFSRETHTVCRRRDTPQLFVELGDAVDGAFNTVSSTVSSTLSSTADALERATSRVARKVASDVAPLRRLLGASGGVSAFLAVDTCLALEPVTEWGV